LFGGPVVVFAERRRWLLLLDTVLQDFFFVPVSKKFEHKVHVTGNK
jgi:hypothetical protein